MMSRTVLALALAATLAVPAWAADSDHLELTIYRSDSAALFSAAHGGSVDAGHAVVHEQRRLQLTAGTHDVMLGDLPDFIDAEAVHLGFGSAKAQVISQRLLLPRGENGTLSRHIGKSITVLGADGKPLAKGLLVKVNGDGSLVIGGDVFGPTVVRSYTAVKLTGGTVGDGARLQLRVDAAATGNVDATLTYPTGGIGWRVAYTGTLESAQHCRMQLRAEASIANRSGRDWTDAAIKLVAGAPRFAKAAGPHIVMEQFAAPAARAPLPQQGTLGDYRTYDLPGAVTLPTGSVTLTPLYKPHTVDCKRDWVFEHGNTYRPAHPSTNDNDSGTQQRPIVSTLSFKAFDSLPAGNLRVLTAGDAGNAQFIGAGQVDDTPKGQPVNLTLGTAFDLTATQERTSFAVDQAARTMDEAFRVTLTNAGESARTITVREHPWRWRNWTLTSSSIQPDKQTPDTLEFEVQVPAHGSATLDYAVQYSWTQADE